MTNHQHLRERAEAAVRLRRLGGVTDELLGEWDAAECDFIAELEPETILALLAELEAAKKDAERWRAGMDKVRKTFLEKEGEWRNHALNYTIGASEIFQGCANELSDAIDAALNPAREDL